MTEPGAITVVIADDHARYRTSLAQAVAAEPAFVVVGQAGDGLSALELVTRERPALALLDVAMPGLDGVEVCRRLRSSGSPAAVVLITASVSPGLERQAAESGARGVLSKDQARAAIIARLLALARDAVA